MKKAPVLAFLLLCSQLLFAQNEIGPEGDKLVWVFGVLLVIVAVFMFTAGSRKKKASAKSKPLFGTAKAKIGLEKDSLYYPDNLTLTVKNTGNADLDLDQPLLEFDNFWLRRKFRIKGMENKTFYPLYLEKDKTHCLQIDLARFYGHDKSLKKFPKIKVSVFDVNGKRLGSKSVFIRKTLIRF